MTLEEAIQKSAGALKVGVHQKWVELALLLDGIPEDKVPIVIRWAKQFNLTET